MSDTSQGPGWWQASDGKWYAPQGQPEPQISWSTPGPGFPPHSYMPAAGFPPQSAPFVTTKQNNPLAIASLVCSCLGIIPFLGLVGVILGIIFGFVARGQIRRTGGVQEGSGLALAGIIIGFVLIGIGLVVTIAIVAGASHSSYCNANPGAAGCP